MKPALRGGLLLAALAGVSCGRAPTVPSTIIVGSANLVPPPNPSLSGHFLFTVTPAASCAKAGQSPLFGRTFEFELLPKFPDGPFLVQPVNRSIEGPNSGSVTLLLLGGNPPGTGMLTGTGLAADGQSVVGFGLGATTAVEGFAFLMPATGVPPNEMTGDLQGSIWVSASNPPATTPCFAGDHKYKLAPKS
jgi:hypothetical protein